jgi:hypothetical protein
LPRQAFEPLAKFRLKPWKADRFWVRVSSRDNESRGMVAQRTDSLLDHAQEEGKADS